MASLSPQYTVFSPQSLNCRNTVADVETNQDLLSNKDVIFENNAYKLDSFCENHTAFLP